MGIEPVCNVFSNSDQIWMMDGKYHREDGPATIKANGTQVWWVNNQKHRIDGPALIWDDGSEEWWINGQQLNTANIEQWMRDQGITWPFDKDTQVEFLLTWG